ncbi:diguanylate cyclase [Alphaproteobacteria bacterium]|nr:diguanylate cyclase [Alphaproteobacteria bacterium]
MDTVLFGGLGFLILCGICFLTIRFIDRSSLKDRSKRLFNYAVLGTLMIATILIFRWHSGTYLISN